MVSVSIFALRDVIRRVQSEYATPFNSISHTNPATQTDHQNYCKYLKDLTLQQYTPERDNNQYAMPARELMSAGAQYANKPSAFRNFRYTAPDTQNFGVAEGAPAEETPETTEDTREGDGADFDLGHNGSQSLLDEDANYEDEFPFLFDEEEYPPGTDIGDYIAMTRDIIDELSLYE